MALSYQWKWLRGQKLTAKFDMGTTALGETFGPVRIASNLMELPTAGCELLGVVPESAAGSATGVPVIISNDVFEVQVKSGTNLALGDPVAMESNGSVDAVGASEYTVGYVVDYDPAASGIAHIRANFTALEQLTALDLGAGEVTESHLATGAVTVTKIGAQAVTEAKLHTSVAGAGLTGGNNTPLAVVVDDSTVEIATDTVRVKDSGIVAAKIGAQAVTEAKLHTSVAGAGLTGGNNTPLAVVVDDSTVEIATDTVRVKDVGITTAKLAADAVDGTKLADDAVNSEHIADGAIDPAHFAASAVEEAAIAAGAVTETKIGAGAVTNLKLGLLSVDTAQLALEAVDTAQIADGAVETAKLALLSVDNGQLAADAVDGTKLADNAVDSEHIAAGAVDDAHLAIGKVAGSILTIPISALANVANNDLLVDGYTPGFAGKIGKFSFVTGQTPASTPGKDIDLTCMINAAATTGGLLTLLTADIDATGKVKDATAITADNAFDNNDTISVKCVEETAAFVEGEGFLLIRLDPA